MGALFTYRLMMSNTINFLIKLSIKTFNFKKLIKNISRRHQRVTNKNKQINTGIYVTTTGAIMRGEQNIDHYIIQILMKRKMLDQF